MNATQYEDYFRVTSIPFSSSTIIVFSGVPIKKNSFKLNVGKYYITIKVDPNTLPVQPTLGQYWLIKGPRQIESIASGGYLMEQHIFQSPEFVECRLPEAGEHLISFIAKESSFKGVGESKARALWELLGKSFHSTLKKDTLESRKLLRSILSEESINALFEGYTKYKNLSYCNWLSQNKIPASVQLRLLKYHTEQSIEAIKLNPYLLVGFGMSFTAVDALSQTKFEIALDDHRRLSAALEIAIRKEVEKGHTYTTEADLRPHLTKLLKNKELVDNAFMAENNNAQYLLNQTTGTYHPTAQLLMENVVAKRLKSLSNQYNLYNEHSKYAYISAVAELPYDLTQKQVEAVLACLDNAVSCITGGAGTGKTTVLRTVISAYSRMGFEIHAVALSGRAAMRLQESISFTTSTIAKLLRGKPIDEDNLQHLLVIDEAS
ncbi:AAA family ATPase, partial [Shewanella sp. SG41-4]|uniref:AAA family ATPase n=1 Tax=Shewanella sp. SG41-4 TaxID=2760976 RepID=UPI001600BFDF